MFSQVLPQQNTTRFVEYINKNHEHHSHLQIARRVFECLDYIQLNMDKIMLQAGKVSLLRHPTNKLAFHLNGLNTPQEVKDEFTKLIAEVHGCLNGLLFIEDTNIRNQIIDIFLLHINDSDVGCMEMRLRNAITFFGIYQSAGLLSINNLMHEFYETYGGVHAVITVKQILEFFSDKVENHLLVINNDKQTVPLSWSFIQDYMQETLGLENIKDDWMQFAINSAPVVLAQKKRHIWHHHYFEAEQQANQYLSSVKSILPDVYQVELAKASVNKDEHSQYYFMLSDGQYKQFKRIIADYVSPELEIQNGKEKVQASHPEKIICYQADALAQQIADMYKVQPALVKSVRWDNKSFNIKFIAGITKSPVSEQKEDQRKGKHKEFTVYATGVYDRANKPSPYAPLTPEKIKRKKKKRSAFQSTSLVTPLAQTPVFGHGKERADKLVGYIFDLKDAMINRMYIYDGGTRSRPYEFDIYQQALAYYIKATNPDHPVLFSSVDELAKVLANHPDKYSEILARIRWNVNTSAVSIFSDTFEAKCIAQLYARQTRDRLQEQYKELNKPWDDSYEVPIIFYIPGSDKNLTPYTKAQQLADRQYANRIFQDEKLRNKASVGNNYEFLLLLDNPDEIFDLKKKGMSSLKHLLYHGELHLVESLLYRASLTEEKILAYFHKDGFYRKKRPTIDDKGNKAMHLAAELGHSTLKLLLAEKQWDVNLNTKNKQGQTPFALALMNGQEEAIKILLADRRMEDIRNYNTRIVDALMAAAGNGNLKLINILLSDKGFDKRRQSIYSFDTVAEELLCRAATCGRKEIFNTILADHRLTHIPDSVLFSVLSSGRAEILNILLADSKMDAEYLNAHYFDGSHVLYKAATNSKYIDILSILLADSRVDVTVTTSYLHTRATALMGAAECGNTEGVKIFLADKRINAELINAVDADGFTALDHAVSSNHIKTVKLLLTDTRVDINVEHKKIFRSGHRLYTALQLAAYKNHLEIVKLLLADPRINVDDTPYDDEIDNQVIMFLIINARLAKFDERVKEYRKELQTRQEDYAPSYPLLHKMDLFGLFSGYTRDQKLTALNDLYEADKKGIAITNKTSIVALHDGKLGKITEKLPEDIKRKLGL